MIPGPAALCEGTVTHRRVDPEHQFTYPMSQVWIDPDDPGELCDLHPAWSHRRPAPAWFRRADYGTGPTGSLADSARDDLGSAMGRRPSGPVRMLSQVRRWGWLFNPISVFLVWDDDDDDPSGTAPGPVGAVLEVTNTPWKERTRYALGLGRSGRTLDAEFDKSMHVSPFVGMDVRYRLEIEDRDDAIEVDIDVIDLAGDVVLGAALSLDRRPATRELLGRSVRCVPFPTHRVSAGIHAQAARLWAKGAPFLPHPGKTRVPAVAGSGATRRTS